jgi:transaldolase
LSKDEGALTRKMSPEDSKAAAPVAALDEKAFRWMMNEDPMATDKLAEGIRTFAKDLGALRNLVNARLAAAA